MSSAVVQQVGKPSIHTKVHFVLSGRDLPRRERGIVGSTVQDPYVKWSERNNTTKEFAPAGQTTHRNNEPNPDFFDTVFLYEWIKGSGQVWHFEVMDVDPLNKDDVVGFVDVDVDDFLLNKQGQSSVKLSFGGSLLIKQCTSIKIQLTATHLPKLDAFKGMSDPFVKCFWSYGKPTKESQVSQTLFATTKTIKNVDSAQWEPIDFSVYQTGTDQYWTFVVLDKDTFPKDDNIGTVHVHVDSFMKEKKFAAYKLSEDPLSPAELIVTKV